MIILNNEEKFRRRALSVQDAARKIRLLGLDIDGVLTDGRVYYGGSSENELKCFDVKDGLGIKMLMRAGIRVGVISGRRSTANRLRATELGLDFFCEKCSSKREAMAGLCSQYSLQWDECAFIGDDLIDCEVLQCCGLGFLVSDCSESALPYGDLQTTHAGGRGAVREVTEWLLHAQGKWEESLAFFHLMNP